MRVAPLEIHLSPRVRRSAVALVALSLSGCGSVWLDPYIDYPDPIFNSDQTGPFPRLLASATKAEERRKLSTGHRHQLVVGQSVLRYGTFGAAVAGGVAAVYGAHNDLILGFGIGATGAYSASSLFASTESTDAYGAADRALNCIVRTATATLNTAATITSMTMKNRPYYTELNDLLNDSTIQWKTKHKATARSALSKYSAALDNFTAFQGLDHQFATVVDDATATILEGLNKRLRDIRASLQDVLQRAQGIGIAGQAFAANVAPPFADGGPTKVSDEPQTTPKQEQIARLTSLANELDKAATTINTTIAQQTNRVGEISSMCILDLPPIAPLTASTTEVTVAKDQVVKLTVSGGKEPVSVKWLDAPPSDQIELDPDAPFGRKIALFGKSALEAGGTYTLLIRDSMAAPTELTVTVKTQ